MMTKNNAIELMRNVVLGKHVLVRCTASGVHFGELVEWDGAGVVFLHNARRLWQWSTGGEGITLSEIAIMGIAQKESKISTALPEFIVTDVIEIMPCHGMAIATISGAAVAKPE